MARSTRTGSRSRAREQPLARRATDAAGDHQGEYVWGVDTRVGRLAFGMADLASERVHVISREMNITAREGERLAIIERHARDIARQLLRDYPPAAVFVEQPAGRTVSPVLWYAVGVVQAALFDVAASPVWSLPPSKWKLVSHGKGNVGKAVVAAWAAERGVEFTNQDEADAASIAHAGRAVLRSGRFDVLAA
jgi:Holliday junction resolvasome RuvABC endonuclease subunit